VLDHLAFLTPSPVIGNAVRQTTVTMLCLAGLHVLNPKNNNEIEKRWQNKKNVKNVKRRDKNIKKRKKRVYIYDDDDDDEAMCADCQSLAGLCRRVRRTGRVWSHLRLTSPWATWPVRPPQIMEVSAPALVRGVSR